MQPDYTPPATSIAGIVLGVAPAVPSPAPTRRGTLPVGMKQVVDGRNRKPRPLFGRYNAAKLIREQLASEAAAQHHGQVPLNELARVLRMTPEQVSNAIRPLIRAQEVVRCLDRQNSVRLAKLSTESDLETVGKSSAFCEDASADEASPALPSL